MNYRKVGSMLLGVGVVAASVGCIFEPAATISSACAFTLIVLSIPFLFHGKVRDRHVEAPGLDVDYSGFIPTGFESEPERHVGETPQSNVSGLECDLAIHAEGPNVELGDVELGCADFDLDFSAVFPFF